MPALRPPILGRPARTERPQPPGPAPLPEAPLPDRPLATAHSFRAALATAVDRPELPDCGALVEQLAGAGATGVLHGEHGSVYLVDGAVTHAESPHAPGLAVLLTTGGRLPPAVWQQTLLAHGPARRVGRQLVEQGHLSQGELELCHLSALYDAGYFVLSARADGAYFEPGVRHWLGPVRRVGAHALHHETLRRRRLLARIWPWPQVDNAPLVPAATPPGRCERRARPRLGPHGRELLALADCRRTPADLALLLGRSAFATTAEVRRLAAAGYLETPFTGTTRPVLDPRPTPDPRSLPEPRSAPDPPPARSGRPDPESHPSPEFLPSPQYHPSPEARLTPDTWAAAHPVVPLPRRSPGATRPRNSPAAPPPPSDRDPDIALLTRVLTALEARL
ncbi:hypothetical protein CFP65_6191 [Kitasatospora sp. MMS16-BH015]|uniref:hypothetical protein n=1 Tax=Kitasatospora sp. MMS16-BH015 TaxID=2018025 RepID=UPI000CA297DB|nr:hypothetical protein [Kitasatospora sp. MMS16-BH015]AUG80857.1 hypothetical protein CFP65_6191 [Kitasatospora sp. MMS16-BH015]